MQTNLICSEFRLLGRAALPQRRKSERMKQQFPPGSLASPTPGKSLQADDQKQRDSFYIFGKSAASALGPIKQPLRPPDLYSDGYCRGKWQPAAGSRALAEPRGCPWGTHSLYSSRHLPALGPPRICVHSHPKRGGPRCCLLALQGNVCFCFLYAQKTLRINIMLFHILSETDTKSQSGWRLWAGSWKLMTENSVTPEGVETQ